MLNVVPLGSATFPLISIVVSEGSNNKLYFIISCCLTCVYLGINLSIHCLHKKSAKAETIKAETVDNSRAEEIEIETFIDEPVSHDMSCFFNARWRYDEPEMSNDDFEESDSDSDSFKLTFG